MTDLRRSGHGGHCCGMTHIWNFPASPETMLDKREEESPKSLDTYLTNNPEMANVINEYFPAQTALERLDEILCRIDEDRPQGIVEAVLIASQVNYWNSVLTERGFKCVNDNMNSNSGNRLYVYHRNT